MSRFKPGDRVRGKISGDEYRIEFGPYGNDMYAAVGVTDGIGHALSGDSLEPIPPADPRVELAARAVANVDNDGPSEFAVQESDRQIARAVLAALDAHSEDAAIDRNFRERALSAVQPRRVRDRDGDVWEQNSQGSWDCLRVPEYCGYARRHLEEAFGPLEEA